MLFVICFLTNGLITLYICSEEVTFWPHSCWLINSESERHMFSGEHTQWMRESLSWDGQMRKVRRRGRQFQICHDEEKLIESQWWETLSLPLSFTLSGRLLGCAVQLNQQQAPHQSIIISLSPRIPPVPPPPWWTGVVSGRKKKQAWGGLGSVESSS